QQMSRNESAKRRAWLHSTRSHGCSLRRPPWPTLLLESCKLSVKVSTGQWGPFGELTDTKTCCDAWKLGLGHQHRLTSSTGSPIPGYFRPAGACRAESGLKPDPPG